MLTFRSKISNLQNIISKMPLDMCIATVLPEIGVRWRDVTRAIRSSRLPMTPMSVARTLCKHVAKSLNIEALSELVSRLRLKIAATQRRIWHTIKLSERISDEPVNLLIKILPLRVMSALKGVNNRHDMKPQIQIMKIFDLIYISIQMVSDLREGSVLYVATPPGEPVALVSSLHHTMLLACVEGLGYNTFEDIRLYGHDVPSLLRMYNANNANCSAQDPVFSRQPCLVRSGIDFTGRKALQKYSESLFGPNPPLLLKMTAVTNKYFFDPGRLDKGMKIELTLKSDNIVESLKCWIRKGALSPMSGLVKSLKEKKDLEENNDIHM